MNGNISANKTIAKNTLFLYFRLFATLLIGLYTSRIVLRELGITDYGINNVVGSLLSLFTFIQGSLSSASSRFLAFEIGRGKEGNLNKVFCMTINIHILFSIIVIILCETVGLWYVYNLMVIPPHRFTAALIVYQMSLVGSVLSILVVPYNAMIIAQEHMNAFAYLSIINVVFKLLVAYVLCITPIDKLVTFSILTVCFSIIVNILYVIYCNRKFVDCKYRKLWDIPLFKDMMAYSGWTIASYASIVVSQLSNLLVNSFFGPIVNAARAVSVMVQQNVYAFVSNFQVALNPQIIKNYAADNKERVFELVNLSQKISFSLMLILFLPVLTNIDFILDLWLVEVPLYTGPLVILVAISSFFIAIVNPLGVIGEAANRLKLYNSVTVPFYLLSIVVVYIALRMGCSVIQMFLIFSIFDALYFLVALRVIREICNIPIKSQLLFYVRTIIALVISGAFGYFINSLNYSDFYNFIIKLSLSLVMAILIISFVVLSAKERNLLSYYLVNKLRKHSRQ